MKYGIYRFSYSRLGQNGQKIRAVEKRRKKKKKKKKNKLTKSRIYLRTIKSGSKYSGKLVINFNLDYIRVGVADKELLANKFKNIFFKIIAVATAESNKSELLIVKTPIILYLIK